MTPEEGPWSSPADRQPEWSQATDHLSRSDPVLGALIARIGLCTLVRRPNSFASLVGAIVAQQISAAAARTIHKRLWALTRGEAPGPRDILKRREATLRRVGLSRQKIAYLRDLAARIEGGELDLAALESMEDDAVRAALTAIKGIGNWTADMHLIFTQNRPDIFAPGDAAVLAAMRDLYGLADDAGGEEYERIADGWRPYRSIGVWYMYEHIHVQRAERAEADLKLRK